jgi:hypothetical protein
MFSKTIQRDCLRSICAAILSGAEKRKTDAKMSVPVEVDIIGMTVAVSMENRVVDDSWSDPKHDPLRVTAAVYIFQTPNWRIEMISGMSMLQVITCDDEDRFDRDMTIIKLVLN